MIIEKWRENIINKNIIIFTFLFVILFCIKSLFAFDDILIEAESFNDKGGWKVDQQFTHIMGSPYLLAHGMGKPVKNAKTQIKFPTMGKYYIWVRTKNWVPGDWNAPGRFQVIINKKTLDTIFGTETGWNWQKGGAITITKPDIMLELKDLTGFDGRCDAIFLSKNSNPILPNKLKDMQKWRDELLNLPEEPESAGSFDVVIVGGGVAGCSAALAADEQGLKVAIIQDRPVFGGNASAEIRVSTIGITGKSDRIISKVNTQKGVRNLSEKMHEEDKRRQKNMDAAKNVIQFLNWRAYNAETKNNRIISIDARHIETGRKKRFYAPVFIDCTGDGWVGYWAGAEYRYGRESKDEFNEGWGKYGNLWSPEKPDNRVMGTSLMFTTWDIGEKIEFPEVPWAMEVAKDGSAITSEWYWEYSRDDLNQIDDAEEIRDHLLRAVYGNFYNAKKNIENAYIGLRWVAYIGGKRESRRLIGDHIYTMNDMVTGTNFPDTVAEETRFLDLHYQRAEEGDKYDYLSKVVAKGKDYIKLIKQKKGNENKRLKRKIPYYIPFRSLYSKNIDNLMMAGRCFSCSHVGLGGPRVMNTCGQMGIAVGYASSLCKKYNTFPRGVYQSHILELQKMIGYDESENQSEKQDETDESLYPAPSGENIAKRAKVMVSSEHESEKFPAKNAIDGNKTIKGRWVSGKGDGEYLILEWNEPVNISRVRIWTGWKDYADIIYHYTLEYWDGKKWQRAYEVKDNQQVGPKRCNDLNFKTIQTGKLKLNVIESPGFARVFEIEVYE